MIYYQTIWPTRTWSELRRFYEDLITKYTRRRYKNKLFFDEEKKRDYKKKKYIKLTAGEYEVLLLLLKREGFIVSRMIFLKIWYFKSRLWKFRFTGSYYK